MNLTLILVDGDGSTSYKGRKNRVSIKINLYCLKYRAECSSRHTEDGVVTLFETRDFIVMET